MVLALFTFPGSTIGVAIVIVRDVARVATREQIHVDGQHREESLSVTASKFNYARYVRSFQQGQPSRRPG